MKRRTDYQRHLDKIRDREDRRTEYRRNFTLNIELGNEAMATANDVAEALQRIAGRLYDNPTLLMKGTTAKVTDLNGNVVGTFKTEDRR